MVSMSEDIVGVAGDWHGNKGWTRLRLENFAEYGVTKVLQLGDFGFWPGNNGQKWLHRVNKVAATLGITVYVTPGNHEDYNYLSRLNPAADGSGWLVDSLYPQIMVAPRGHRWEWAGTSFVSLGGANSIDRQWREPNVSWWKGEQISLDDVFVTVNGGKADVMVAHDCPLGVPLWGGHKTNREEWPYEAFEYANLSREMMRKAVDGVKPELFLHGHYHFLAQHETVLNDGVEEYPLRSVGLACDGMNNNIALLSLPDLELSLIKYYVPDNQRKY